MIFVIGTPGIQPRMYLDGTNVDASDAARQLRSGEVYFTSEAHGGAGATINMAGNGFDAHVMTFAEAQATAWKSAKDYREMMRNGGCATPLGRVQTDSASQRLIDQKAASAMRWMSANQFAALGVKVTVGSWSVAWVMADNSVVAHSASDFAALHEAVCNHTTACQAAAAAIRAKIFAATTVAAVQAIDITAGYPTG